MNAHVITYLRSEIEEMGVICLALQSRTDLPFDYYEGYQDWLVELIEMHTVEMEAA